MVAKINSGASIFGALSYNLDKVNEQTATIIHTNNMIHDPFDVHKISMNKALLSFENICWKIIYMAERRSLSYTSL